MKRVFSHQKDLEFHQAISSEDAKVDVDAYAFLTDNVIWPSFEKYLHERHGIVLPGRATLDAIRSYQHLSDFQRFAERYVAYNDRVLFWKFNEQFFEPDVWELSAADLASGMIEWSRVRKMNLIQLVKWKLGETA